MSIFDGVAGRWGLDELSGVDVFDSFGSLNGTAFGADIETTTVKLGPACRDFPLANDTINFGNVLDFERTDPFSWAFWVFPRTSSNNTIIATLTNTNFFGYEINLLSGRVLFSLISGGGGNSARIRSNQAVTLNMWNSIVCTYDGSSSVSGMETYINNISGNATVANTLSGSILGGNDLVFGERPATTIDYNGFLDEVVAYNRELSAAEASEFWNGGAGIEVLPVSAGSSRRKKVFGRA
jgi:hypothetical protein